MENKKYILIAEDDQAYGKVYHAKLVSAGYEVVVIANGGLVIPEILKRTPDLLVLDLMMPDKSGFQVLEEIRANADLLDLKVIVASNLSQEMDIEKVRKFKVVDYFIKSDISLGEMVDKIGKAISN
ncbi:MAG: response regulator [bacterium]|nr:response regulator [bacterium]